MKVVVISRNTIIPSRPTPDHLRHVQLSFLDQIHFSVFQPVIYFYPSGPWGSSTSDSIRANTDTERRKLLKKSLAETLTRFYPLAGRLRENLLVECNDDGVYYLEAQAKCQLSQLIAQPNHDELMNELLPNDQQGRASDVLLAVQVTTFDCGGTAIGVCVSHKLADGLSLITFINNWAAAARGDRRDMASPKFDLATHFPPPPPPAYHAPSYTSRSTTATKEKIVGKSFVFSDSVISALRAKYAPCVSLDGTTQPSRVEALSAFIWSRFVAATASQDKTVPGGRSYQVILAVNLRPKMNPPQPDSCFGNLSRFAVATPSMDSTAAEGDYGMVTAMRDALEKIDGDYVKKFQDGNDNPEPDRFIPGEEPVVSFTVTSAYRFPIYEADFGWGKPIWMTIGKQPAKNVVVLLPTRSEDGIEALIYLKEDDMAKLEADKEFLAFVSPPCNSAAAKPCALFFSSL